MTEYIFDKVEMKCVSYNAYYKESPSETIEIVQDAPLPVISSSEVLVKLSATSLNAIDWKMANGKLGMIMSLPFVPCFDVSGVVVSVGSKVKKFKVGEAVYGYAKAAMAKHVCGCAAEYVAVSPSSLSLKPSNISFVEAASFPLVSITAYQSFFRYLYEGCKVLILGGSGGTGSIGIQLAKSQGAYVASTCSTRNIEHLQNLGVDRIINYREENWYEVLTDEEELYDIVYDCVGDNTKNYDFAKTILKKSGHFVTIVGNSTKKLTVGTVINIGLFRLSKTLDSIFTGEASYAHVTADATKTYEQLPLFTKLIEEGAIVPTIDRVYPLDEFVEAMEYMSSGVATGKVVIEICPEDTLYQNFILGENPGTNDESIEESSSNNDLVEPVIEEQADTNETEVAEETVEQVDTNETVAEVETTPESVEEQVDTIEIVAEETITETEVETTPENDVVEQVDTNETEAETENIDSVEKQVDTHEIVAEEAITETEFETTPETENIESVEDQVEQVDTNEAEVAEETITDTEVETTPENDVVDTNEAPEETVTETEVETTPENDVVEQVDTNETEAETENIDSVEKQVDTHEIVAEEAITETEFETTPETENIESVEDQVEQVDTNEAEVAEETITDTEVETTPENDVVDTNEAPEETVTETEVETTPGTENIESVEDQVDTNEAEHDVVESIEEQVDTNETEVTEETITEVETKVEENIETEGASVNEGDNDATEQ
eukprot:TRINITY_DN2091_c0_g1_i4.p1 TRINITY_DN2091_c0_g1~~TRINITY_DN2091_c0_g1_i4.p1  ORF type:complete len:736 (-),score=238.36 TRINITY_DN2091_c0_g1_i4:11-2197(-)